MQFVSKCDATGYANINDADKKSEKTPFIFIGDLTYSEKNITYYKVK